MIPHSRVYEIADYLRDVSLVSNCRRRRIACAALDKDGRVIGLATNGTGNGDPYCSCGSRVLRPTGAQCQTEHAEIKLLADLGLRRRTQHIHALISTKAPCTGCTNRLLFTPCKVVYYLKESAEQVNKTLWHDAGRQWVHIGEDNGKVTTPF